MLAEIGAVVVIVKNLLDGTKTGLDLFGRRADAQKRVKHSKIGSQGSRNSSIDASP